MLLTKFEHALDWFHRAFSHVGRHFDCGPFVAQGVVHLLKRTETHEVAFVAPTRTVIGRNGNEMLPGSIPDEAIW